METVEYLLGNHTTSDLSLRWHMLNYNTIPQSAHPVEKIFQCLGFRNLTTKVLIEQVIKAKESLVS